MAETRRDNLMSTQVVDGREDFRPAADAWVRRALALEQVAGDAFVPTGCLQFLARVFEGAPRPRLFLADFSELQRPVHNQTSRRFSIQSAQPRRHSLSTGRGRWGAMPRRRTRRSWPPRTAIWTPI